MDLPEELLICGSAASEAVPAIFCDCELCREAWKRGGKDWRSRCSYQLGPEIKIDFGPDAMLHREKFQLHYEELKHLFITHPHRDHYTPVQLTYHIHDEIGPALLKEHTFVLHGTAPVIEGFKAACKVDFSRMRMELDELRPDRDCRILENGMKFTGIMANHLCEGALNYIIEMPSGFTFFIGTDSAEFEEKTWKILKEYHFDLMILDGTAGLLDIEKGSHMTASHVLAAVRRLREEKIIDDGSKIVTNHFAHCAKMLHSDLESFYRPHGIEPAFDGMKIKLSRS